MNTPGPEPARAPDGRSADDLDERHARHCTYLRRIIEKKDHEILRLREALQAAQAGPGSQGQTRPAQGGT